jgi:hypothetical protein
MFCRYLGRDHRRRSRRGRTGWNGVSRARLSEEPGRRRAVSRLDVFTSSASAQQPSPFLLMPFGSVGRLPAHPGADRWRYLATIRPNIDPGVTVSSAALEELSQQGFHITWRPPL